MPSPDFCKLPGSRLMMTAPIPRFIMGFKMRIAVRQRDRLTKNPFYGIILPYSYIAVRRAVKCTNKRAVYNMSPGSGIPLFRASRDRKGHVLRGGIVTGSL
jgi:hypothetical protein